MNTRDYQRTVQSATQSFFAGQYAAAKWHCEQLLKMQKKSPEAMFLLAQIAWHEGERLDAIAQLQKYVRLYPKDLTARYLLGDYLNTAGRHREAIKSFERILSRQRDDLRSVAGLANAYENQGDPEKALEIIQPYVDAGTETPAMARVRATILNERSEHERAIEVARPHAETDQTDDNDRAELWYTLGQAYEKSGEIDLAFSAYENANRINPPPFDQTMYRRHVDELIRIFTPATLKRLPRASGRTDLPVFVAAWPRSGSTLLEKIIGSHPKAHDAGELLHLTRMAQTLASRIESTLTYPECVADLEQSDVDRLSREYLRKLQKHNPGAKRITDKFLGNWIHLGLIQLLFPQSRVIDLQRNPVDNCLSCYMSFLGPTHPYSYDLNHLADSYQHYRRLMTYWREVLELPILRVQYEDMVAEPEREARRIIEFLDLPWDPQCLEFYRERRHATAAPSLSYNQVRRPIYKSAVGRAEKFRKHIGPLLEAFEGNSPRSGASSSSS